MCVLAFEISHRPNGKLTFCSLLTGRWCRSLRRHSDHLIVHHKLEHSFNCARSSSRVPNAPLGELLTCLPRLLLAQLRTLWSTTGGECCRNLENFPSPHWESLADMFNLTLAFQLGGIHLLFYQGYVRACKTPSCSCSKVPMAPMGKLLTRLL